MKLMNRAPETETQMPTLEDLHRLAKDTNDRVDRMEAFRSRARSRSRSPDSATSRVASARASSPRGSSTSGHFASASFRGIQ